jgi:hypothetical protein
MPMTLERESGIGTETQVLKIDGDTNWRWLEMVGDDWR